MPAAARTHNNLTETRHPHTRTSAHNKQQQNHHHAHTNTALCLSTNISTLAVVAPASTNFPHSYAFIMAATDLDFDVLWAKINSAPITVPIDPVHEPGIGDGTAEAAVNDAAKSNGAALGL